MVLLHEIVQMLRFPQLNIKTGVNIYAFDSSGVGTALIDGNFLWQTMQVDGALYVSSGRRQVTLGNKKEVDRIASVVDRAVQMFPLAGYLDVGLVHAPTVTNGALASAKN